MKKHVMYLFVLILLLAGCSVISEPSQPVNTTETHVQIANPWKSYDSLEEAENACSLTFPIPMTVADIYAAESFRVMNNQLLEVIYRASDEKVIVRMQSGEEQDISGVYGQADSTETTEVDGFKVTVTYMGDACVHLIYGNGNSFSLYAPNGYQGDACSIFLSHICTQ